MYKLNKEDMFVLYLKGVADGWKQGEYLNDQELFEWYRKNLLKPLTIKDLNR